MVQQTDVYGHIQVSGEDITAVIKGITATTLCNVLLAKYDLHNVQKGQFYPLGDYLSLLSELEERMPTVLRSIGKHIISEALFPPAVEDFEQALEVADTGYYMNHPGAEQDEIGHYLFKRQSDPDLHMIVDAPYPCAFDEGVILGMAARFNVVISLKHYDGRCRSKSDSRCHYRIEIMKRPSGK